MFYENGAADRRCFVKMVPADRRILVKMVLLIAEVL
jgi:hypothetical protein